MQEPDIELDRLAHAVIGAAIEVHRELGPGFLESTYAKALAIELTRRKIHFVGESPVQLYYKGESIGDGRIDLLVEDRPHPPRSSDVLPQGKQENTWFIDQFQCRCASRRHQACYPHLTPWRTWRLGG